MASLTFSFNAQSQNGPSGLAISHMPKQANGFLILDQQKNPTVTHWKVEISTITYDSISSQFVFNVNDRIDVWGTNFLEVNDTYLNDAKYFVSTKGLNASNIVVVEEGPLAICPECPTSINACTWGCVGKTYAYGLDLWVAPNGGSSFLSMKTITPTNGSYPYYYQWVAESDWANFSTNNPNSSAYYGLSSYTYNSNLNGIIQVHDVPFNDPLYDATNNPCTGLVYGIKKQYGPWTNAGGALEATNITGGQSNCNQNFSWAIGKVNSNTAQFNYYNVPTLSCNDASFSPTGSTPNPPIVNPIANDFAPCYEWFEEAYEDEDGNLYVVLSMSGDCITNGNPPSPNSNTAFSWPANLVAATIKSNHGADPIVIKESDLFDANGAFIGNPIVLTKGLYTMGLQFSDNSYASVFFERNTPISSTLTESDFLSTNIYAVPIQGNSFTMDLIATAKISFNYTLFDSNSNILFENNYVLDKDAQLSELITIENGIPRGVLINKYTFSDGSEITFQTIK